MDEHVTLGGIRQLLQDIVAPDLKALQVRMDALEKRVDSRLDSLQKSMDSGFESLQKRFDELIRYHELEKRMLKVENRIAKEGNV